MLQILMLITSQQTSIQKGYMVFLNTNFNNSKYNLFILKLKVTVNRHVEQVILNDSSF